MSSTTAQPQAQSPPTRTIGRYVMGPTLGEGGFSKVKLGWDPDTNAKVALKILKKEKLNLNANTRKQVEREIEAMALIQHENVIRLKEVQWDVPYTKKNGKNKSVILTVLECASGGELFDYLSFTGQFDENLSRTYFHQLINGVGYCHSKGIAHRDLKPENLLLDDQFTLKLADFGFANSFSMASGQPLMYTECGTPLYMAPDVMTHTGYDPTLSDIWSCGVILFTMLAGFPPFQKPTMQDWWFNKLATDRQHLFWQAHERSASFSPQVKDFINRVLQPDPSRRMRISSMNTHPWFQGPTMTKAALISELSQRKQKVDLKKLEEKREAERARLVAAAQQQNNKIGNNEDDSDGSFSDGDVAMHRGVLAKSTAEADSLELPIGEPSLADINLASVHLYAAVAKEALQTDLDSNSIDRSLDTLPSSASSSSSSPSASSSSEEQQKQNIEPPVFDPKNQLLSTFTSFRSSLPASQLFVRVQEILRSLKFKTIVSHPDSFKIKGTTLTVSGQVVVDVQIYVDKEKNVRVVELRRRQGNAHQFRMLYSEVQQLMNKANA